MAILRTDEISEILRQQIENYDTVMAVDEVGTVISVGAGAGWKVLQQPGSAPIQAFDRQWPG